MGKDDPETSRAVPVPSGRANRLARLGGLATGIAGNMVLGAMGDLSQGTRPEMRRLFMTPANLRRLAEELSRMRGAAMKVGQLISMDAGDVLPPELAGILARLRDQAHFMPPRQLKRVLAANWPEGWLGHFRHFETRPLAAASIGQVHKAELRDGRSVAIKVQYPGIARSIDSDVANVGALIRMSGMLPRGFDLAPFLAEARRQLHEETDYLREGEQLRRFGAWLADDNRYRVPAFHPDWSTPAILCMDFVPGLPIENVAALDPATRRRVTADLIDLTLREIFRFGAIQSDPNFANFRYDPGTGRIVLLDFGAARDLDPALLVHVRVFLRAGWHGDADGQRAALQALGVLGGNDRFDGAVLRMIAMVFDAVTSRQPFDFAASDLLARLNAEGTALAELGYVPPGIPMDALYLQRKLGGMFLLATRLGARVSVGEVVERYLDAGR